MEADFQPASVRNIARKCFLNTHKKETSLPVFALPYLYGENLQGGLHLDAGRSLKSR